MSVERTRNLWIAAALVLLLGGVSPASATPTLQIGVSGGGPYYDYEMTLINTGGTEPLSGLNLLAANTIFGLDDTSTIMAPSGWDYFAPLPPTVDELNYFSLSGASDVPIGGSLGGFSFLSTSDPNAVDWDSVEADAIGGESSSQIPLQVVILPEPTTALLVAVGLALQAASRRRRL